MLAQNIQVARLNDQFRDNWFNPRYGTVLLTQGVRALLESSGSLNELMQNIAGFNGFTEDNDPYQERDFGSISYHDETLFFKIDYYDKQKEFGSEGPANPAVTCRVMTIMLTSEY